MFNKKLKMVSPKNIEAAREMNRKQYDDIEEEEEKPIPPLKKRNLHLYQLPTGSPQATM